MRAFPPAPGQPVTLLLGSARAQAVSRWLTARLQQHDAKAWLAVLCEPQSPNCADGEAEEALVRDAFRRARARIAGDAVALSGADVALLERVWHTLGETAADPVAAECRAACRLLERDLGAATEAWPLQRVGHFVLEGVIGAGGSGTVYRASHSDNGQSAAVKVLHPGLVDAEIAVRFRNEARIAGRLCHPAIVRLLDSGVQERSGAALPYVAYELIDGVPFHQAMAGQSVAAILRTFAQLCDGVQHAHDNQVLHRDLKPANVLVDTAGNPRVLDFGIACSLAATADHGFRTLSGQVLGTPGFMSPEQAAGRKVDVRGDVWSLGAMLFHALSQQTPHDVAGLGVAAALARVSGDEPRRLRTLRPDLDRDLVAVVDKAVAGDPADRYASVADLVRDVRRLLAGDPVDARSPSTWQSFRVLMRRHRVGTLVALVIFVTAAVGGIVAAVLWQQAVHAEARAVRLSAEALAAATGGIDMAARLAETTAAAGEQLKLVEPLLAAVTSLHPESGVDAPKWRRVESRLREIAGDLYLRRGDHPAARTQRERVLAIETALVAAGDGSPADHARAMVKLGDLDAGPMRDVARNLYERAHGILLELTHGSEVTVRALDDLSWSFDRLAGLSRTQGRDQDAIEFARQHVALARRLLAMSPDALRGFNFATAILQLRACEHRDESATAEDLAEMDAATTAAESAVAADPGRRAYLIAAFQCRNTVSRLLLHRGEPKSAIAPALRAAALSERLHLASDDAEVRAVRTGGTNCLVDVVVALCTAPPPHGDRAEALRVFALAEARLVDDPDPVAAASVAAARASLAAGR